MGFGVQVLVLRVQGLNLWDVRCLDLVVGLCHDSLRKFLNCSMRIPRGDAEP